MNFLDLFCGAGGASLGYTQAGLTCKYAVDFDQTFLDSHEANHPGAKHIKMDIGASLDSDLWHNLKGKVDLVHGSPPCQPYSEANNRKKTARLDTTMIETFLEIVRRVQPKYWVMENVVGVYKLLAPGKYPVRLKLHATRFGVPQSRVRTFAGEFSPPNGYTKAVSWGEALGFTDSFIFTGTDRRPLQPFGQSRPSDQPASTLTGKGPSQWHLVRSDQIHDPRNLGRLLTIDECKIIQGFPKDYVFLGTKTQQQKQLGNAVPPAFTKAIGSALGRPGPLVSP